MIDQENTMNLPWYRQFWFWFVFGPLIFIIVLCIFTVSMAFKVADDVVIDNYYKEGRMINQVLEQDEEALALGLTAEVTFDRINEQVFLTLHTQITDPNTIPKQLLLMMGNPAKAAKDQLVILTMTDAGQYQGKMNAKPDYSWYLTLYSNAQWEMHDQAKWILSGKIDFRTQQSTRLGPRIGKSVIGSGRS